MQFIRDVIPAYNTITEMIIAVKYFIRPYPKGCLQSGFLDASLVPTIVITLEDASDILFTSSRVIAMDPLIIPITALNSVYHVGR